MAKFGQMLLNRGHGSTGRLLAAGSFEQMIQNPLAVDWAHCEYGYGLEIHTFDGIRHLGHGGGMPGYQTRLFVDLENGLGVVMLSSSPSAAAFTRKLMSLWRAAHLGRSLERSDLSVPNPCRWRTPRNTKVYRVAKEYTTGRRHRLVLYSAGKRWNWKSA
jgi:CubicO group peptidase (beta-lactamase class C family)